MFRKISAIKKRTIHSVKNFKEDAINNMGYLIVMAIVLTSIVVGIVAYVLFIIRGGYSSQIALVKNQGISSIVDGFSLGTVSLITSGIVANIIYFLAGTEVIVMLISYFKNSGRTKRTIMIVNLILGTIIITLTIAIGMIAVGEVAILESGTYKYLDVFEGVEINFKAILVAYLIVVAVIVVAFIILIMITAECRRIVGHTVLALIFAKVLMPLLILVLENIIPLMLGTGVLVIAGIIIFIIFKVFFGSSSSAGSLSDASYRTKSITGNQTVKPKQEVVVKEKYQKKKEYNISTPFWRDKGGSGIMTPQADSIYFKNNVGATDWVCTVKEFEDGDVAIINKGKRVTNIAGCKTPKR